MERGKKEEKKTKKNKSETRAILLLAASGTNQQRASKAGWSLTLPGFPLRQEGQTREGKQWWIKGRGKRGSEKEN